MKIAVLGAGAMGSIYGGHLSADNDVYMIDKKAELVDKINADGLKLFENNTDVIYHPTALLSSEGIGEVDLVIIFVKALYSRAALMENKGIIGDNTYVMTLQNGAGHEDIILFAVIVRHGLLLIVRESTSPKSQVTETAPLKLEVIDVSCAGFVIVCVFVVLSAYLIIIL